MEEKELVPVENMDGKREAKLKAILNTQDLSTIKLSDIQRDNLVPALNFIIDIVYRLQEKYAELQEVAGKLEHVSKHGLSEGKEEISKLENDIKEQEKAIKKKEKEADAAKSKFPGWVTYFCWMLVLAGIWPGIVAFIIAQVYYDSHPTADGLKAKAKLLEEAEPMKQKLEDTRTRLERLRTFLEADVDEQKRSLEAEYNKLALSLQGYIQLPEVNWALNALSEDYMNYDIIEQFIKYLEAGRADNLKEAINLFEEELHRGRLEDIQKATLEASKANLEATSDVARLSAWTAQHTADIAETSAASAESLRRVEKLLKKGQNVKLKVKIKQTWQPKRR